MYLGDCDFPILISKLQAQHFQFLLQCKLRLTVSLYLFSPSKQPSSDFSF